MSKIEISQSLISLYQKYKTQEECGEYLRLVYITKEVESESSVPMRMGARFEYEALTNLDYNGRVPEPFLNQNGSISAKQYTITIQASNFKQWMIDEGNTIVERGKRIFYEFEKYTLSAMRDLVFLDSDGKRVICDLKMSGNLGNKESEWGWHEDTLLQSEYKIMQAMMYFYMDRLMGENPDSFVFYVASSTKQDHKQVFRIIIREETLNKWIAKIHEIASEIAFEHEVTGFTAYPGNRCAQCAAKNICTKKNEKIAKGNYTYLTI